jgi:hypothetical protein
VYTDFHSSRVSLQLTCVQVIRYDYCYDAQAQVGVPFMKAGASTKGHFRLRTRAKNLDSNGRVESILS